MPVLTVWGFPEGVSEENIERFKDSLKTEVAAVEELEITPATVFVFIPALHTGKQVITVPESGFPGTKEIVVIVDILFDTLKRTKYVRQYLAERICQVVAGYFPRAAIRCFIKTFDPVQGYSCKIPQ